MKTLKSIISENTGMRFIVDELQIMSSTAKKMLLNQKMFVAEPQLTRELANVSEMRNYISKDENKNNFEQIKNHLSQIKDIHGTLNNLKNNQTLGDIELFEIKHLSIIADNISALLDELSCHIVNIPNQQKVIEILDPESQKIPHFYIYSSYSKELERIRIEMKIINQAENENFEKLRLKEQEIEEEIRIKLSKDLYIYNESLIRTLNNLSYLDLLISKSELSIRMNLSLPEISKQTTDYQGLVNPYIKNLLEQQNKNYQPIDIKLEKSPCIITGANMGGKTILLKSIALSQYMFQFGFFVPATKAKICIVDEIICSIEDKQSDMNGLSSFASEMLNINHIIQEVKKGRNILALIDELARTTNPDEGLAIVNAIIELLDRHKVRSLITTHYSGINAEVKKLRVKGLILDKISLKPNINDINNMMDYSLVEDETSEVPADGIKIAEIIGVDSELISLSKKYYSKKTN